MSNEFIIALNNDNFETEVLNYKGLVVVDFWAAWCGPCQMLTPIIENLAKELQGKVKVCKLNVDEAGDIAMKYRVMNIPTVIFFKDGEQVKREVGAKPKEELLAIINSL